MAKSTSSSAPAPRVHNPIPTGSKIPLGTFMEQLGAASGMTPAQQSQKVTEVRTIGLPANEGSK